MKRIDYDNLIKSLLGETVPRPNSAIMGTLSGHAAGEPFEKRIYQILKKKYPKNIFKQHEYLNDLYLKHPKVISVEDRYNLFKSPTALFLLSRGDRATKAWSPNNIFSERQNDTADILFHESNRYEIIDIKTHNNLKNAQPPNIISAYKLAQACTYMIDNEEYDNVGIHYIEVDWIEKGKTLQCVKAYHADLFKCDPRTLYINWAATMQLQFFVCDLDQFWDGTREQWAREYLKMFVESAKRHIQQMKSKYITPFLKYIK